MWSSLWDSNGYLVATFNQKTEVIVEYVWSADHSMKTAALDDLFGKAAQVGSRAWLPQNQKELRHFEYTPQSILNIAKSWRLSSGGRGYIEYRTEVLVGATYSPTVSRWSLTLKFCLLVYKCQNLHCCVVVPVAPPTELSRSLSAHWNSRSLTLHLSTPHTCCSARPPYDFTTVKHSASPPVTAN